MFEKRYRKENLEYVYSIQNTKWYFLFFILILFKFLLKINVINLTGFIVEGIPCIVFVCTISIPMYYHYMTWHNT